MIPVHSINILRRCDEEEEGDFYYEYQALDPEEKVLRGSRWCHLEKDRTDEYVVWLTDNGFDTTSVTTFNSN